MSNSRKHLLTCGCVVGLAAVLMLTSPSPGHSAQAQNVVVMNTAATPVPTAAQGTTMIAGTVDISGTPTVSLSPGASVAITGTPTVGFAPGSTIGIDSGPNNPVFVRSVDDALRDTFQKQVTFTIDPGDFGKNAVIPVPVGKRAVIEHVSVSGNDLGGNRLRYGVLTVKVVNGIWNQVEHYLVADKQSDSLAIYNASQPLRAYSDPGTTIVVEAGREMAAGSANVTFSISGYYVAVP